jgi:hypothetical protein
LRSADPQGILGLTTWVKFEKIQTVFTMPTGAGRQKRPTRAAAKPTASLNETLQSQAEEDAASESQQNTKDTSMSADTQTNRFKHLLDPIR